MAVISVKGCKLSEHYQALGLIEVASAEERWHKIPHCLKAKGTINILSFNAQAIATNCNANRTTSKSRRSDC